jgi:purine-binding chemotaxis protein CheW
VSEPTKNTTGLTQYCTFRLGHLAIGVDVQRVREVIRHELMTKVPMAPPEVKGLINLRGQIITALDLREQLGLPADGELRAHVVIGTGEEAISLMVDEVGDVVTPSMDDYEPMPAAVPERVRHLLSGAYKLENRLLLVLETQRVTEMLMTSGSSRTLRRSA